MTPQAKTLLEVGDVISADKSWSIYSKPGTKSSYTLAQVFNHYRKTKKGLVPLKNPKVGKADPDKAFKDIVNGRNEFLVVQTANDGGGSDGRGGAFPNGHHVHAVQLDANGQYDPNGLKIDFYQTGCFIPMVTDVEPVRKMKMTFV